MIGKVQKEKVLTVKGFIYMPCFQSTKSYEKTLAQFGIIWHNDIFGFDCFLKGVYDAKADQYNAEIYVRLLQEDMRADESLSIEKQKLILTKQFAFFIRF